MNSSVELSSNAVFALVDHGRNAELAAWLSHGGDPNLRIFGKPLLFIASEAGHAVAAGLLLDAGARIDERGPKGVTALMAASRAGHHSLAGKLVERGADHAAVDFAEHGYREPSRLGSPIKRARGDSFAPLAIDESSALAQFDPPTPNKVFEWAEHGQIRKLSAWLAQGGDPNLNLQGKSLLLRACESRQLVVASALADAGARLDAPGPDGNTPLKASALRGHAKLAASLLMRGANPDLKNHAGLDYEDIISTRKAAAIPELASQDAKNIALDWNGRIQIELHGLQARAARSLGAHALSALSASASNPPAAAATALAKPRSTAYPDGHHAPPSKSAT